jgi:hypothetical protein
MRSSIEKNVAVRSAVRRFRADRVTVK